MSIRIRVLVPLAALCGALAVAQPSLARAVPQTDRDLGAPRGDLDRSRLLAAAGVVILGCGSLGGVALISRRQPGYFGRR